MDGSLATMPSSNRVFPCFFPCLLCFHPSWVGLYDCNHDAIIQLCNIDRIQGPHDNIAIITSPQNERSQGLHTCRTLAQWRSTAWSPLCLRPTGTGTRGPTYTVHHGTMFQWLVDREPLGFESSSGFRYTMEAPIFVRASDAWVSRSEFCFRTIGAWTRAISIGHFCTKPAVNKYSFSWGY